MDPAVAALHAPGGSLPSDHLLRIVATSSSRSPQNHETSGRQSASGTVDEGSDSMLDASVLLQRWWLTKAHDATFSTEFAVRDLAELLVRGLTVHDDVFVTGASSSSPSAPHVQPLSTSDEAWAARFREVAVLDATNWDLSASLSSSAGHQANAKVTPKPGFRVTPVATGGAVARDGRSDAVTAVRTIVDVLTGSSQLQILNLSRTPFAHVVLRQCVAEHGLSLGAPTMRSLTSLLLADCKLGSHQAGEDGVAERGGDRKQHRSGALHDLCLFLNSLWSPAVPPRASSLPAAHLARVAVALQTLNVAGNHLTSRDAPLLATAMRSLTKLQAVNWSDNPLGSCGAAHLVDALLSSRSSMVSLSLRRTSLGPGESPTLAHRLSQLTKLRALDLAENNLGVTGITWLAPCLCGFRDLESLDLGHNALADAGTAALVSHGSWLSCERLTALTLSSNRMNGRAAASHLAIWLRELPHLEVLDISDNNLGADGWALVGPQLRHLRELRRLDARHTGCHDAESYAAMAGSLRGWNHPGGGGREEKMRVTLSPRESKSLSPTSPRRQHAAAVAAAADIRGLDVTGSTRFRQGDHVRDNDNSGLRGLTFLSLQGNRVPCGSPSASSSSSSSSTEIANLNRFLRHNGETLTSLHLDDCAIGGGEMVALAQHGGGGGLLECRRLAALSLERNPFGSEGAQALSRCFLRWGATLQRLSLRGCKLGQMGIAELVVYLSELSCLTALDLSETVLGDGGAEILGAHFSSLGVAEPVTAVVVGVAGTATGGARTSTPSSFARSLCELNLDGNGIGRRSCAWEALLGPLGGDGFPSLRKLTLSNNPLGDSGAVALSRFIGCAPALRELDVSNGSLTNDGVVRLLDSLTLRTSAPSAPLLADANRKSADDDGDGDARGRTSPPCGGAIRGLEMHSLSFGGSNIVESAASIASVMRFLKSCRTLRRVSLSVRSWPSDQSSALMRLVEERCHILAASVSDMK